MLVSFYRLTIFLKGNTKLVIIASPTLSSSNTARLGQIQAQLELARNFYDDDEFCPVQCSSEVMEHRDRIQQRLSPQSSPSTSPSLSSASSLGSTTPPRQNKSRRAIPIIDPANMAPVSVPPQQQQQYMMKSPIFVTQQQQQYMRHRGYDVLVQ